MSFIKYAAPVAALVGATLAADGCTFSQTTTVSLPADVSAIGACSTVSGGIVFATGAAAPMLSLPSVEEIDGSITYENDASVTSFQAPMLKKITGAINFNNLSNLHDITWNSLQTSNDVTLVNVASLSQVTIGNQYSQAGTITLSNTYLSTMGGFGNLTKVNAINVQGNPLLGDITMNINSVKIISIGSNEESNGGLNVAFNNLTMALDSITVQNATNVSFTSLKTVTNNLALIANNFQTFSAPNLTYAGGIVLNSNPQLNNISLPALTTLNGTNGTFQIANNSKLETIGGFPQLTDCEHDVIFTGSFKNASISQFKKIAGAMNVASTEDINNSVCSEVNNLKSSQVIRGKASCSGQDASAGSSTSTTGTGSGSSTSSSAAAIPLNIPALPALSAGLGAALLQFLLSI